LSWQLVSFALVLLALAVSFWWYERSRPPAKLIAVIATLAALAALGRDAFAAIPDVKPITAIVLVSGVAFGPGPGFAVGALSALASNILLGEGPWTPWQMLGWGLVGLAGAALGRLTARRMAPLALALACAAAAELFNLVVDLYTWTGSGSHTIAGFGVVLGSAATFDLTHVIASFAFGLAFAGVLLRMLVRVRSRLHVSWEPAATDTPRADTPRMDAASVGAPPSLGALAPAAALLLAGAAAAIGAPAAARATAGAPSVPVRALPATSVVSAARADLTREVSYLTGAQNPDGGFGAAPGQGSSELYTAWAAIGLAAAGDDPQSVRRDGHTVLDALRGEASSLQGAGDLERTILALRACGASVRSLPGGDPVRRLLGFRDGDGSFGHLGNLTAFAILALRAAGYPSDDETVHAAARWLARQQEADGGFGFAGRGAGSDVDDTGAVVQALVQAGARSGTAVARASAYLVRAQSLDGGYPQRPGGLSNAQSTAWAVQGLVAAGRNPATFTRAGSRSPLGYLQSLTTSNGSVRYSRTGAQTPVWVTAQALTALAEKPLPVAPWPRAPVRAPVRPPASSIAAAMAAGRLDILATRGLDALARALRALLGRALAPAGR
jgi:prenyltransferase beta subunit